jgi:hypothetical protein
MDDKCVKDQFRDSSQDIKAANGKPLGDGNRE